MREEFAFLMTLPFDWLVKLTASFVCGGLIGFERASKKKDAGIRTHVMICMGATLYMLAGELIAYKSGGGSGLDPTRIAGQIVTGMGFIGAGSIMKSPDSSQIVGLTTAATTWVIAAIGIIIGVGFPLFGVFITLFVLMLLLVLGKFLPSPSKNH